MPPGGVGWSSSSSWPAEGVLWVDRHLHKNGGSTMREVMLRNEEAGRCTYYGYTQTHEGWERLIDAMRNNVSTADTRLPRLCIEAHASQASAEFTSRRLPQLIALREHFGRIGAPVRIVVTTRVRDPLSYYLSFYRWRVAGMQRHGNVITLSPRKSVVNPLGASFLEWSPRNLQSIGLLHGDVELFAGLKAGGFPGVRGKHMCGNQMCNRAPHPYWTKHQEHGRADHRALLRVLRSYDVVAPVDRFDEALLMTSEATGLPPLQESGHVAVVPDPQGMSGVRLADATICPDMAACRAHVESIAPWDVKLYRSVRRDFAARVRREGPALEKKLAELRAARARGEGGACEHSACCCNERRPCFNLTGRDVQTSMEPPPCVPNTRSLQRLVSSDMPLGWCCVKLR